MVEPVYPLTEGLTLNLVRKAAEAALTKIRSCRNGRTPRGCSATSFPAFADALHTLHHPAEPDRHPAGEHGLVAARL